MGRLPVWKIRQFVPAWMARALCARYDDRYADVLFFPEEGGSHPVSARRRREARRCCAFCPVRRECLLYALRMESETHGELVGLWAGVTAEERASTAGLPPADRARELERIFRDTWPQILTREERRKLGAGPRDAGG